MSAPGQHHRHVPGLALRDVRPDWLTAGAIRLGLLCLAIVAIGMLSPRLSPHSAGVLAVSGAIAVIVGVILFVVSTRRLAEHLPFLSGSQRLADAVFVQLRRIGLPLLGLLFFLFWTFVYVALWAVHPGMAFRGLGPSPRFSDFFYYAVSTALISPPGDIIAHSRGARSATMIEMLTGFAVLTAYLSSFIDWSRRSGDAQDVQTPD